MVAYSLSRPDNVVVVFFQIWLPIGTNEPGSLASVEELSEEDPLPSPKLRLHIAIEVISYFWMAQESRSLVDEELPLIDFLLDQMVLLKEMVLWGVVPSIALELLLQRQVTLSLVMATSVHQKLSEISVMDVPVVVVGSPAFSVMVLGLQASGVVESFEGKPSDLAALEVGPKGATLVCSHRTARLAAKCRGGAFKLPVPCRHLPYKVVSKWHMARPRSCSSRLGLRFVAAAPLGHSGMSCGFLRSACYKDVETLFSCVGCYE
jgi:hypothetical protein